MAKAKKKTAKVPEWRWKRSRVYREDAGGVLYNAVHVETGVEHWGVPSYDAEFINRRVAWLNSDGREATEFPSKPANMVRALQSIFELYDGKEVDSDTHDEVALILADCGYDIRDPNFVDQCEECGQLIPTDETAAKLVNHHARGCKKGKRNAG